MPALDHLCLHWTTHACTEPLMCVQLGALRWLLRLMLEPHAAPAFLHLQDALAALLDGVSDSDWSSTWLPGLVAALASLGEALPHSALVRYQRL